MFSWYTFIRTAYFSSRIHTLFSFVYLLFLTILFFTRKNPIDHRISGHIDKIIIYNKQMKSL